MHAEHKYPEDRCELSVLKNFSSHFWAISYAVRDRSRRIFFDSVLLHLDVLDLEAIK